MLLHKADANTVGRRPLTLGPGASCELRASPAPSAVSLKGHQGCITEPTCTKGGSPSCLPAEAAPLVGAAGVACAAAAALSFLALRCRRSFCFRPIVFCVCSGSWDLC